MPEPARKLVVEAISVVPDAEFPYFAVVHVSKELVDEVERLRHGLSEHRIDEVAVYWTIHWEIPADGESLSPIKSWMAVRTSGVRFRLDDLVHARTVDIPFEVLQAALDGVDHVSYYGGNEKELRELYTHDEEVEA